MADRSNIEWTDSTFNPWIGCTKVSPACDHCYAEAMMDTRMHRVTWGAGQARVRTSEANWRKPLAWNRAPFAACTECGGRFQPSDASVFACRTCPTCGGLAAPARRRVFCASLADVFDNEVDPQWRADLLHLIFKTPELDWLLLTKRIGNARDMLEQAVDHVSIGNHSWEHQWSRGFRHVALGATICNQSEADRDIPKLLATPAAVRFVSIEPMLGPINLFGLWSKQVGRKAIGGPIPRDYYSFLNWVIAGGESGPHARPSHPDWFRSLRDQCAAAGAPFLFKQWGEWVSVSEQPGEGPHHQFDDGATVRRIGKKAAGRLLDGVQHNGFPEVRHA